VLVAEDDVLTRMLVKVLLEREGCTVLEARTGREAIEVAARERPSLVVMDLQMPEMSGYDAIAQLRRVPALASTPVLVISSDDSPSVKANVLELGADDYLAKPFNQADLSNRVRAAMNAAGVRAA
jgi:DNA-binding response OmpR family regulator